MNIGLKRVEGFSSPPFSLEQETFLEEILVARAILKDSNIVIFDEATSELDSESEERIENLIRERFKEKTCIIKSIS